MELEHLFEFSVVARLFSFSKAAEELCISQSSLSKHIIALERELGVQLFDRTSRSVSLTGAGAEILQHAQSAVDIRDKILSSAAEYRRINKASLKIASIPVMAHYDITGAIAEFCRLRPDVELTVTECESAEIVRLLTGGYCDLAFTRRTGEGDLHLDYHIFCTDSLVAVLPKSHKLAGESLLDLSAFRSEQFLFLDQNTALYNLCVSLCEQSGFTPSVRYSGHRPENIADMVSRGMGISLLMKRHAEYIKNPGVLYVDISPNVESEICLAKVKGRDLTRPARAFWDYVYGLDKGGK